MYKTNISNFYLADFYGSLFFYFSEIKTSLKRFSFQCHLWHSRMAEKQNKITKPQLNKQTRKQKRTFVAKTCELAVTLNMFIGTMYGKRLRLWRGKNYTESSSFSVFCYHKKFHQGWVMKFFLWFLF